MQFPAKWTKNGSFDKTAGFNRNEEMAKHADAAIIIWDGKSKGTKHMLRTAIYHPLKVCLYQTDNKELSFFNLDTF